MRPYRNLLPLSACLAAGLVVSACSGNGSDDDDTQTEAPATPTATATDAISPSPTPIPTATPTPTPETPTPQTPTPTATAVPSCDLPEGCDAIVCPSSDDQAAVQQALIDATEGQTVCLSAGTFSFYTEVSIAVNDVTLRGAGADDTTLDFTDQIVGGNGMHITADGVTVERFKVLNTPGDGIRSTDVEVVVMRDLAVIWTDDESEDNGAYGLYPVGSHYVTIERCEVKGARDAGVYVGQSRYILVSDNEAWGNVAGIEIENSSDAEVVGNWAHDNTGGVLVFNLPDLPVKDGKRTLVHDNLIENNNTANFAPSGNIVGIVPQGTGVILLATDENEFTGNIIRGNQSAGMAIFSYDETLVGEGWEDPDFDPYPERNFVHDNILDNNGYDPQDIARQLLVALNAVSEELVRPPLPSILWDGCINPTNLEPVGEGEEPVQYINCLSGNGDTEGTGGSVEGEATYGSFDLCGEVPFSGYTLDIGPMTCVYDEMGPQSW